MHLSIVTHFKTKTKTHSDRTKRALHENYLICENFISFPHENEVLSRRFITS